MFTIKKKNVWMSFGIVCVENMTLISKNIAASYIFIGYKYPTINTYSICLYVQKRLKGPYDTTNIYILHICTIPHIFIQSHSSILLLKYLVCSFIFLGFLNLVVLFSNIFIYDWNVVLLFTQFNINALKSPTSY